MMVDLSRWMNPDKNFKAKKSAIQGTMIQSLGDLKGYTVQIVLFGMAIPSKVVMTNEEAKKMEAEIWEAME